MFTKIKNLISSVTGSKERQELWENERKAIHAIFEEYDARKKDIFERYDEERRKNLKQYYVGDVEEEKEEG